MRLDTPAAIISAIANGEERPFFELHWGRLLEAAEDDWDNPVTLFIVLSEALQRTRKNPASKAQQVVDEVAPRFTELVKTLFPPEPEGDKGYDDLNASDWPRVGLLRHMGYTVGQGDPGENKRRLILTRVFKDPIPSVNDPAYMAEWNEPGSAMRLRKVAWSIASFCVHRLRKNQGNHDKLTSCWRDDLEWLRCTYYEGHFGFPWPPLDIHPPRKRR